MSAIRALLVAFLAVSALLLGAVPGTAEETSGAALIEKLRGGGYTLYFRHAATDWSKDDHIAEDGDWKSCDPDKIRQLSDAGRATARRVGEAMRKLGVPVGDILSSEYCRAVETARLLGFGAPRPTRKIMNLRADGFVGGRDAAVRNAQEVLSRPPKPGTNTLVAGHGNLANAATGVYPDEGGSVVVAPAPGRDPGFKVIARLSAEDWIKLAR